MKKIIKNYTSFLNEADVQPNVDPNLNQPGPERALPKENKYKFQMEYSKSVEDKLIEYGFGFHTADENVDVVEDKKFIIIDVLNLTYSIDEDIMPEVRMINMDKLENILDNL